MDEFISKVTQNLGIGEQESRSATGGILKMLKGQLDESSFGSLLEKVPGAETLLGEAESNEGSESSGGGGGLMGSLTSMAGSLLGGGGDSATAGAAKAIGDAGIGMDKIPGFLSTLMSFLKEKLGDDMFSTIASKLPGMFGDDK